MNIIWDLGPATVNDVLQQLPEDEPLAYSTVLTTMRILEQKGYLRHDKQGRAFVYHPIIGQSEARQSALSHMMSRFFNDSPELLMMNLIEQEGLDAKDLERLKEMIKENDREVR
jgi:predicted transcriptional regulator